MSYDTLRQKAIDRLGGVCCKCGETNSLVFEVDHINNDGKHDQRTSFQILKDIANGITIEMFQLLCANCHRLKHILAKRAGLPSSSIHIARAWAVPRGPKKEKGHPYNRPNIYPGCIHGTDGKCTCEACRYWRSYDATINKVND
jgi:hypothetical protein